MSLNHIPAYSSYNGYSETTHMQLSAMNMISSFFFGNTALKAYNPEFPPSKYIKYFVLEEQSFIAGIEARI